MDIKNNNLSYEKYSSDVRHKRFKNLATNAEHIQTSYARYSLIDYLLNERMFPWQYWMVVTFGFKREEDEVIDSLRASHYFFDRWLLTNNKLNSIAIDGRSRWVCIPEYGSEKHLHFNVFMELRVRPDVKTYQSEWDAMRVSLRNIFRKLSGDKYGHEIHFELYERERRIDALKQAVYSTKEMRFSFIKDNMKDNFANTMLSWKDWAVAPINKRSPKKYKSPTRASATLENFF